jgi:acyl phosphate:glycerol-3-phosphate acyltransferase
VSPSGGAWAGLALAAGAYLLGSVSWSVLIVRAVRRRDVRQVGSGNAGATNVMRVAGLGAGALTLALDVGKGVAAVAVPRALEAPPPVVGAAAVAVVVGHAFPLFFGFRGGKGVATSAGALGTLAPNVMAVALLGFAGVVLWKRYVSLGSMVTAALFPAIAWLGGRLGWIPHGGGWTVASSAVIAGIVLARHSSNLYRLRHGLEPRLGEPSARGGEA